MKYFDQGSLFRVTMSSREVFDFGQQWPCAGLNEDRGVTFVFEKSNGDLIDTNDSENHPDADGGALSAMMDDCKAYGLAKLAKAKVTA